MSGRIDIHYQAVSKVKMMEQRADKDKTPFFVKFQEVTIHLSRIDPTSYDQDEQPNQSASCPHYGESWKLKRLVKALLDHSIEIEMNQA
ncbi:MAG: hypothetical protein AB7J40_04110 [Candidatus Altimarinota bacterium]